MSAYEELVERCVVIRVRGAEADKTVGQITEEMLAEILRTLEEVTPEMVRAANGSHQDHSEPLVVNGDRIVVLDGQDYGVYLAMLHASALQPRALK